MTPKSKVAEAYQSLAKEVLVDAEKRLKRSTEGLDDIFRPKNPGRKNSGSRYNRFPSANFSLFKTTRSKFWTMIP